MMTVSADCRLRPRPPALVLSRNTKYSEAGSLNVFSSMPRSSALVVPVGGERLKRYGSETQPFPVIRRQRGPQTLSQRCLTVQTQVLEVTVGKIVLHDGHEGRHLTEEQHFVVGGPQLGQDAVQQLKLPRGAVQVGAGKEEEE